MGAANSDASSEKHAVQLPGALEIEVDSDNGERCQSIMELPLPKATVHQRRPAGQCFCGCIELIAHLIVKGARNYRMRQRPRAIILVRHGESLGNVEVDAYSRIPDNQMPLTAKGKLQAEETGRQLAQFIGKNENVMAFVSPYKRTEDTFRKIDSQLGDRVKRVCFEPDLREQDFGNYQDPDVMKRSAEERKKFGRFFYRFPNGESAADVYTRMELFMNSLFRHMDLTSRAKYDVFLIVTHGISMRVFMMRFLRWTVKEYEEVWNPKNCEAWMLERDAEGEFSLNVNPDIECMRRGPQKSESEGPKRELSDWQRFSYNRTPARSNTTHPRQMQRMLSRTRSERRSLSMPSESFSATLTDNE